MFTSVSFLGSWVSFFRTLKKVHSVSIECTNNSNIESAKFRVTYFVLFFPKKNFVWCNNPWDISDRVSNSYGNSSLKCLNITFRILLSAELIRNKFILLTHTKAIFVSSKRRVCETLLTFFFRLPGSKEFVVWTLQF